MPCISRAFKTSFIVYCERIFVCKGTWSKYFNHFYYWVYNRSFVHYDIETSVYNESKKLKTRSGASYIRFFSARCSWSISSNCNMVYASLRKSFIILMTIWDFFNKLKCNFHSHIDSNIQKNNVIFLHFPISGKDKETQEK